MLDTNNYEVIKNERILELRLCNCSWLLYDFIDKQIIYFKYSDSHSEPYIKYFMELYNIPAAELDRYRVWQKEFRKRDKQRSIEMKEKRIAMYNSEVNRLLNN